MGTTLTGALISRRRGHDRPRRRQPRLPLPRRRAESSSPRDHSLVEELRRQGRLTDEEAEEHPQRSVITRALGPEARGRPRRAHATRPRTATSSCSAATGSRAWSARNRSREILARPKSLKTAVEQLIDEANEAGGRDNITAVAFRPRGRGLGRGRRWRDPDRGNRRAGRPHRRRGARRRRRRTAAGDRREPRRRRAGAPPRRGGAARGAIAAALSSRCSLLGAVRSRSAQRLLRRHRLRGPVSLYRGLPYDLPLGIDLYQKQYASAVQTRTLAGAPEGRHRPHDAQPRRRRRHHRRHRAARGRQPPAPDCDHAARLRDDPRPRRRTEEEAAGPGASERPQPRAPRADPRRAADHRRASPRSSWPLERTARHLSLTYGGFFLALCLAAHLFIRTRCPTPTRTCSRWSRCSRPSGW